MNLLTHFIVLGIICLTSGSCMTIGSVTEDIENNTHTCVFKDDKKVYCNKENSQLNPEFGLKNEDFPLVQFGCLTLNLTNSKIYTQCAPYNTTLCDKLIAKFGKVNVTGCKDMLAAKEPLKYCFHGTSACDDNNSKLPEEIQLKTDTFNGYTCINVTYKDKKDKNIIYRVEQCALKNSEGDICDSLNKTYTKDVVTGCETEEPTLAANPGFCFAGYDSCDEKNSKLPDVFDLKNVHAYDYTCLKVDYKDKGQSYHYEQCAPKTGEDICSLLNKQYKEKVSNCKTSNVNENKKKGYCFYGDQVCDHTNSDLPVALDLGDISTYGPTCLDVSFNDNKTKKTYQLKQCALNTDKGVCKSLSDKYGNSVSNCTTEDLIPEKKPGYCFYGSKACDESNSLLPDDLQLESITSYGYTCINVTYTKDNKFYQSEQCAPRTNQSICALLKEKKGNILKECKDEDISPSPKLGYCFYGSKACDESNSVLPDDLKLENITSYGYTCINVLFIKDRHYHESLQCAPRTNQSICALLKEKKGNILRECEEEDLSPSPKQGYCFYGSKACNESNSVLPDDLKVENIKSYGYTCINVTYYKDKREHQIQQCAPKSDIMCLLLDRKHGDIVYECGEEYPSPSSKPGYCFYGTYSCNETNSQLPEAVNPGGDKSDGYSCIKVSYMDKDKKAHESMQCTQRTEEPICNLLKKKLGENILDCQNEDPSPSIKPGFCFYGTDACNEKNSKLPDVLKLDGIKFDGYTCINVTYSKDDKQQNYHHFHQCAPKPEKNICEALTKAYPKNVKYCGDEDPRSTGDVYCPKGNDAVICTKKNSEIPLKVDGLIDEYICLNLTYKSWWTEHHSEQCAHNIKDEDLCGALRKKNKDVKECSTSIPTYSKPNPNPSPTPITTPSPKPTTKPNPEPSPTSKPDSAHSITSSIYIVSLTLFLYFLYV